MEGAITTRPAWEGRYVAGLAALVAAAVAVHLPAWVDMGRIAVTNEEASHVLLVPLVAGWLLYLRRGQFAEIAPRPSLIGPAVLAAGWLLSWIGFYHRVQAFWHGGAVLAAVGAVLTFTGWPVVRRFWMVLLVLAFLVPVPGGIRQEIAIPLQTLTAKATAGLLQLVGLEVVRSGNALHFNDQAVAVAEACNGMRMVFVLVLVCYAVAFANPLRGWVRALLLVVSPLVAIAANILRLAPTVYLFGYWPDSWGPLFHDLSGWAMIALAFALLMGLVGLLRRSPLNVDLPGGGGLTP
ncbi:MAG: exosortase/archaeosortase family protein [Phycisphaeraceae bacterium]